MATLGSGAMGAMTLASMKSAGLDTSKITTKSVCQDQYQVPAAQVDAYKKQLDAQMAILAAQQATHADTVQASAALTQQQINTMISYMNALAAQNNQALGNLMMTHP
jgi:hypothetical protein